MSTGKLTFGKKKQKEPDSECMGEGGLICSVCFHAINIPSKAAVKLPIV